MYVRSYNYCVRISAAMPPSGSSDDGNPQQDGGDVGASVIEHLPAIVSVQCKLI